MTDHTTGYKPTSTIVTALLRRLSIPKDAIDQAEAREVLAHALTLAGHRARRAERQKLHRQGLLAPTREAPAQPPPAAPWRPAAPGPDAGDALLRIRGELIRLERQYFQTRDRMAEDRQKLVDTLEGLRRECDLAAMAMRAHTIVRRAGAESTSGT